jgi:hypothetical protein
MSSSRPCQLVRRDDLAMSEYWTIANFTRCHLGYLGMYHSVQIPVRERLQATIEAVTYLERLYGHIIGFLIKVVSLERIFLVCSTIGPNE